MIFRYHIVNVTVMNVLYKVMRIKIKANFFLCETTVGKYHESVQSILVLDFIELKAAKFKKRS